MKHLIDKLKIYGIKRFLYYIFIDLKRKLWMEYIKGSYSQCGEDLVIDRLLGYKKKGFYVDVGAYDPDRFSNTKRFYLKGWKGINIEPNTINYKNFFRERSRDINLNIGIGNHNTKLNFYRFIPDTLSTFSQKETEKYKKQGYKLVGITKVLIKKLKTILEQHRPHNKIDFFSIDTEGYEIEVLKSNDWTKYKPVLVCIESIEHTIKSGKIHPIKNIDTFLVNKGYKKVFDNNQNSIYKYGK